MHIIFCAKIYQEHVQCMIYYQFGFVLRQSDAKIAETLYFENNYSLMTNLLIVFFLVFFE